MVVLGLLEGEAVEVRRYLSRSVTGTWREVHSKRVPAASGSGRPILRAPMRPIRRPPPISSLAPAEGTLSMRSRNAACRPLAERRWPAHRPPRCHFPFLLLES